MAGMVFFTARPSFLTIQFSQQHIVGLDLSVDLTVVSDDPFSFQRPFCHAHMDGGLLIQPSGGVAAVVDAFLPSGAFQIVIGHIRPPCDKLFLTVPAFGDRILSAVSSGFRMLVCSRSM